MYAKVFSSILDSSIWLEPDATRVVWFTLLLSMDADGYAHFSTIENLSKRANVDVTLCNAAIVTLLNPDPNSGDLEHEGRRIQKVPGGYIILNAAKYRSLTNDVKRRESTRLRVQKFRDKNKTQQDGNACNALQRYVGVTSASASECTSEKGESEGKTEKHPSQATPLAEEIYKLYPKKVGKLHAIRSIEKALKLKPSDYLRERTLAFSSAVNGAEMQFVPYPATWFNEGRYDDDPRTWKLIGRESPKYQNGNQPKAPGSENF